MDIGPYLALCVIDFVQRRRRRHHDSDHELGFPQYLQSSHRPRSSHNLGTHPNGLSHHDGDAPSGGDHGHNLTHVGHPSAASSRPDCGDRQERYWVVTYLGHIEPKSMRSLNVLLSCVGDSAQWISSDLYCFQAILLATAIAAYILLQVNPFSVRDVSLI